ncbi:MAG: N-acetylmuramoyl-L-alanine amidase [Bacillota bacterium]|jgi:N-acetylmuramoyl-L-alanine amidase|nr:hypothetical protein [Candidatus Fermentithermobacillaceae bacterium]
MGKARPLTAPSTKTIALAALVIIILLIPVRGDAAPLLRLGDYGDSVAQLQELLVNAGFDPGPVDGIFGPRTQAATMSFQRSAGLVVDGIAGPVTWGALERLSGVSRGAGPLRGRTIVIDPGHGGPEPGAISYWGDKEKDFTLGIATKVRRYLEDQGAIVVMTRYGDYSPGSDWSPRPDELLARVSIANSRGVDLFLSIHINAYPKDPGVSGVMGFYRAGSWESQQLARTLAACVSDSTGLRYIDTQQGPYYVLNNTYMPAALMEIGFMTNWNDVSLLRQNWFQEAVARGLARGVREFLNR